MDRRDFMKLLAAGSAGELALAAASNQAAAAGTPPKILVVGGGMAGATVAKFLCFWGNKNGVPQNVWIIDQNPAYQSCILSNSVLTGERADLSSLTYNYSKLAGYGVNTSLLGNAVTRIDTTNRIVYYGTGADSVTYDILILAMGVEFLYDDITIDNSAGAYANALDGMPHAWKAGQQTILLRDQLKSLANGEKVIITIPPAPYRCPPGPYERACVVADWMKKNRPSSKVIVLDANPGITAEVKNFTKAFNVIHKGYIEYHPNARLAKKGVDTALDTVKIGGTKSKTVRVMENNSFTSNVLALREYTGAVLNLIPPHAASKIVRDTLGPLNGLYVADANPYKNGKWALVDELRYRTKDVNGKAIMGVYVIGDSIWSNQPKAGHIGNQEAKICADGILRWQLTGLDEPFSAPVTNSACFTPITNPSPYGTAPAATWLSALYRYDSASGAMKMTTPAPFEPVLADGTAAGPTGDNYDNMNKWFSALMQDVFS